MKGREERGGTPNHIATVSLQREDEERAVLTCQRHDVD